jgi:hypothetical protein
MESLGFGWRSSFLDRFSLGQYQIVPVFWHCLLLFFYFYERLFQNFSFGETSSACPATFDLSGKADLDRFSLNLRRNQPGFGTGS